MPRILIVIIAVALLNLSCGQSKKSASESAAGEHSKIKVIFDTDTNNELDDQHALAYLLLNGETFDLAGVTVNATPSGGQIENHVAEAERVMKLCGFAGRLPVYKGANSSFDTISTTVKEAIFDGYEAVDFIISEAGKPADTKLVIIAVGKLTNLALALMKQPDIAGKIRLVWLGSNYPEPGEYNHNCDTASVSYVLRSPVEFEIVTVRYGKSSGSDAVKITKDEVTQAMPGKGPKVSPVEGRHGGMFSTFGDYSVSLFEHAHYYGTPPSRALFDLVAVAVVKNPGWGERKQIAAPKLVAANWIEQPQNPRTVTIWENFGREEILKDFRDVLENPHPVSIGLP